MLIRIRGDLPLYKIYKYTNKYNGKVYIGRTCQELCKRAGKNGIGYKESRAFFEAIQKYSWEAFDVEILETVLSESEANEREEFYISLYNSTNHDLGYNLSSGEISHIVHDETKAILSEKATKRYQDKTSNPMYGKKHSSEARLKMSDCKKGESNPMYGRKWTEIQREKCGTKNKTLNLSDEQRANLVIKGKLLGEFRKKKVFCIEDDLYFASATDASTFYGVDVSTLCGHINGRQKSCCGKHFVYIN